MTKIMPGLAARIVGWTDDEIAHRRKLEDNAARAEIEHLRSSDGDSRLGLWLGFIAVVLLIGVAGIMASMGMTWASFGLSAGTLVGVGSTFVYGSKAKYISKANIKKDHSSQSSVPQIPDPQE